MSDQSQPAEDRFFLRKVVRPMFHHIEKENSSVNNPDKDYFSNRNYDDFNEAYRDSAGMVLTTISRVSRRTALRRRSSFCTSRQHTNSAVVQSTLLSY